MLILFQDSVVNKTNQRSHRVMPALVLHLMSLQQITSASAYRQSRKVNPQMRTNQSLLVALQPTTCPNKKISTPYSTKSSKTPKLWSLLRKNQSTAWSNIAKPRQLSLNIKLQASSTNPNTWMREKMQCSLPTQILDSRSVAPTRDQELRISLSQKLCFRMIRKNGYAPKISVLHPKDLFNQAMQKLKLIHSHWCFIHQKSAQPKCWPYVWWC